MKFTVSYEITRGLKLVSDGVVSGIEGLKKKDIIEAIKNEAYTMWGNTCKDKELIKVKLSPIV